jgi:hypothetical protein
MLRKTAYKLAQATYQHPGMPFTDCIRAWYDRNELKAYDSMRAPVKRWWHGMAYAVGFRLTQRPRAWRITRKTGNWLVHKVPYNVRFSLA